MAVRFVVIIENRAGRTEEAVKQTLDRQLPSGEWVCFSWEGQAYASWYGAPRYFAPEDSPEQWEALRTYLVRARDFLGGGAVHLGNDLTSPRAPDEATDRHPFSLPPSVPQSWLAPPDDRPDLIGIVELAGLTW